MRIQDVVDAQRAQGLADARVIGLDIGSRATKGVLLYDGTLYGAITPSGTSSQRTAEDALASLLKMSGKDILDITYIVGTGYGRIAIDIQSIPIQIVTEITCHAMGAHYLNPDTRTIIDIGGQDSKVIKVDPYTGKVIEFIMNDKCAAGTGRFLEKVAQMLELELDELGEYAARAEKPAQISSQCVVFAESEVVSLKARGESKENIAAGIHQATARRVHNLLKRVGLEPGILFTGGVSNNKGMILALEKVLEARLGASRLDQTLAGAFGAAIYAHNFTRESYQSFGGNL